MKKKEATLSELKLEHGYCTYAEFSELLGCSLRHVQTLVSEGVIPVIRIRKKFARIPTKRALAKLEELEVSRA
jgi:excisionase family DNA binding protein